MTTTKNQSSEREYLIRTYSYIFYSNQTFTASQFFKNYPDCNVKSVLHLTGETIQDGERSYRHHLKGAAQTSMGTLEIFNYSDLN